MCMVSKHIDCSLGQYNIVGVSKIQSSGGQIQPAELPAVLLVGLGSTHCTGYSLVPASLAAHILLPLTSQ